jgi:thiazole synthase
MLLENIKLPIIVDAGIGRPSQAAEAMEMGAAGVLVNTAVAAADDPVRMAAAFSKAIAAGREAYLAGIPVTKSYASASSPLTGFLSGDEK